MNPQGNRLGLIAIVIGVMALVVALTGRTGGPQVIVQAPGGAPQSAAAPSTPAAPQAPAAQPGQNEQGGGWWDRGPRQRGPGMRFGQGMGPGRLDGPRHGGWFFMPFFFAGHLIRLALAALLIGGGLWLLRGRRGSPGGSPPSEPAKL